MNQFNNLLFKYTKGEEYANSITHGLGFLLSIYGTVILLKEAIFHGSIGHIVCFSIYGFSLILLYLSSTLYHSFNRPYIKIFFKKFDHAAIYLLIAGTYTPIILTIKSFQSWIILCIVWTMAITGIIMKFLCIGKYEKLSVIIYLVMGWLCVIQAGDIITGISPYSLKLLIIGGLSYTLGVSFYIWQRLPYNHCIWHIFVLMGSIFHYLSILNNPLVS